MSIIDRQLVKIEISKIAGKQISGLKLNYQDQKYDLVQAFASHKLELFRAQLQQLIETNKRKVNLDLPDRYVAIREEHYYSIWAIDLTQSQAEMLQQSEWNLELQQASIWLFQELWLQCQDLLGAKQLQVFIDDLLMANPQLKSPEQIERLLGCDPLSSTMLVNWNRSELSRFDRQLYQLVQKKIGREFGTSLTIDIIQSMPASLQSTLVDILKLRIEN
jgi:hypothetical protein